MPVDELSVQFAALADPTRRAILSRLIRGDATVNELAEPFSLSVQAVSKHIQVLERAGLLSKTRAGKARSSHLESAALDRAALWIAEHRIFMGETLDRLEDHLREVPR
jgi:DNA-binding transcriptional ArsR family regulator